MQKLEFNDKWINWICICISMSSFSILLSGSSFGHFSLTRGLRQGDPLSPFLFIIGTEVISHLLHNRLRGFKISRSNLSLNHLLFADDLVIFTSATSNEASIIRSCLEKYSTWFGQSVNSSKSSIIFSKNIDVATINIIRVILPYVNAPAQLSTWAFPSCWVDLGMPLSLMFWEKVKGK